MRALLLSILVACGSAEPTPPAPVGLAEVAEVAEVAPDFVGADGALACPVMGDTVASKEYAAGHTVYAGKTYWFCCSSCEDAFLSNPDRYADGKYLAHLADAHEGRWADCHHL